MHGSALDINGRRDGVAVACGGANPGQNPGKKIGSFRPIPQRVTGLDDRMVRLENTFHKAARPSLANGNM